MLQGLGWARIPLSNGAIETMVGTGVAPVGEHYEDVSEEYPLCSRVQEG